jgi:ribose 5-phosphate isomerase B
MRIAIGSDHAGFDYKSRLKLYLIECGHEVMDFGCDSDQPADYPIYIRPVAEAVAAADADRGIVLGGSGNGEAIVANRVRGVRCTLCWNLKSARFGRQHNDSNVLSLGQRMMEFDEARAIVDCWLETPFEGGRHARRIWLIDHPVNSAAAHPDLSLPRRTELVESASYVCESCREEFEFPCDMSAGERQRVTEVCPVCCHENHLILEFGSDDVLVVHGDRNLTS